MNEMSAPAIGVLPLALAAIVLLVVVFAFAGGRVWSAIVGLGGLLLMIGGLLLVASLLLARPVAGPSLEQLWPLPRTARPYETIAARSESSSAERADLLDTESSDRAPLPAEASTDEPRGPKRPAWMDAPLGRRDGVYLTRATSGFWLSRIECERELPDALREAVATYAEQYLGKGKGKIVNLPMSYIHEHIVRGEWEERRQDTIDTMISLHELLEFDSEANQMIDASYRRSVVQGRLGYVSAGGGAILGLLTVLFGYLKLDTLTRGYYTGRLRLAALAAILGLAVIAGLLVIA